MTMLPRDPECSACRNLLDLQRMAARAKLERQITEDHANGYGRDVDEGLDRILELRELIRTGPHA